MAVASYLLPLFGMFSGAGGGGGAGGDGVDAAGALLWGCMGVCELLTGTVQRAHCSHFFHLHIHTRGRHTADAKRQAKKERKASRARIIR